MRGYRTVSVEVSIDEFDDEDLVRETRSRGFAVYAPADKAKSLKEAGVEEDKSPPIVDELEEIAACIRQGRTLDALVIIDRLLGPKFKHVEECKSAYETQQKRAKAA